MYHIRWKHKNESVVANNAEILWEFVVVCRNLLIRDFILTTLLLQCLILEKKTKKILWCYQLSSVNEGVASHHPHRWLHFGCKGFWDVKEKALSYTNKGLEVWLEIIKLKPCTGIFFKFPFTVISVEFLIFFNFNNFKFRWILKTQQIFSNIPTFLPSGCPTLA